ncbi:hypothetical protein NFI96_028658 [Prochilodus magdalenae]|nr:hypothetical protein NFI96_028658 [Prochilodus magdalenae]
MELESGKCDWVLLLWSTVCSLLTVLSAGHVTGPLEERKVAFSVGLSGGESGNTGPYSTDITLVYKHIFINIGNAYNPATGIFTAPVRGVYQFRFHIIGVGGRGVDAVLHKNGHHVAGAYSQQNQHFGSASNGASLLLEVGDVVYIKLRANLWIFDNSLHHTTFSGQMLFSGSCPLRNRVIQYTEKQMDYSLDLYTYRVSCMVSGADRVDRHLRQETSEESSQHILRPPTPQPTPVPTSALWKEVPEHPSQNHQVQEQILP